METLFWSCLAGGILFAVVSGIFGDWLSLALDGMLDFLSFDGHHWLQPMSVVGGITVFGGAGLLLYRYSPLGDAVIILALDSDCNHCRGPGLLSLRSAHGTE